MPPRWSISQCPECSWPVRPRWASQRSRATSGLVRLAVDRAVELERRVAAEDEAVDRLAVDERAAHGLGLEPGEQLHHRSAGSGPCSASAARDGGRLVDVGGDDDRLDAGGAQQREPGGRGGGEVEAHACIVSCGMLDGCQLRGLAG